MENRKIKNGLCVDIEGYTDINERLSIKKEYLSQNPEKVLKNTVRILDILDETKTKGTFFIIASYVEKIPDIVIEIVKRGHEIGLHGYDHGLVSSMSKSEFEDSIDKSLSILKQYTSDDIIGYQAPDFSIDPNTFWAFDILMRKGFKYDCSIFPIGHPNYGIKDFSRFPVRIKNGFYEIPMPTLRIFGKNIPFGGGGYLRHFPYFINYLCFKIYNNGNHSALTYVHPWEFENSKEWTVIFELSDIKFITRWRYFANCGSKFSTKFEELMKDFTFVPLKEIYLELNREDSILNA